MAFCLLASLVDRCGPSTSKPMSASRTASAGPTRPTSASNSNPLRAVCTYSPNSLGRRSKRRRWISPGMATRRMCLMSVGGIGTLLPSMLYLSFSTWNLGLSWGCCPGLQPWSLSYSNTNLTKTVALTSAFPIVRFGTFDPFSPTSSNPDSLPLQYTPSIPPMARSPSDMCSLVSSMSGSSTSSAVVASSSNTSWDSDPTESINQLPLLIVFANLKVLDGERPPAGVSVS
mmetsp:Transcript_13827/g.39759  ORF Transcript_13827/g.39759 Transcript_13827/m.39759 type:complete len:230 (-) Transcript_13827:1698-2387(-)